MTEKKTSAEVKTSLVLGHRVLSSSINRILGKAGSKTISKIASLLLAAIAVMIVRKGITSFVSLGAGG